MADKTALITGVTGQDGAYLTKFLLEKKYKVFGTYRRVSTPNFWRLQALGVFDNIQLIPADLIDASSLVEAMKIAQPDEIYHLAAQSFVGAAFEQPIATGDISGIGVTRMLEAMRHVCPNARFYQASTSELYGNNVPIPQHENTPFHPTSPYAAAKLGGYWMTKIYRDGYNLFTTNGILFNHESPLRGIEFVTRKISNAVAKIALGFEKELFLGNLDAKRDWGYAPDYIKSMWMMLQHNEPDDFVIATGETHTVREFAEKAFEIAGLDWQNHVKVNKSFIRPVDLALLQGDYSKAKQKLGWEPEVKFNKLVKIMVDADLEIWLRCQKGEHFQWDAPNYPNESKILTRFLR
jgi:GDPmannose 4,6-dehydratase